MLLMLLMLLVTCVFVRKLPRVFHCGIVCNLTFPFKPCGQDLMYLGYALAGKGRIANDS